MSIKITLQIVSNLISEQFPQYADLPIKAVKFSGIDNRTFRLGNKMLIRLPSAERYAAQVIKEQKWLPILSLSLSTQIPEPVGLGLPNQYYPWHWSIYKWIEGTSANLLSLDSLYLEKISAELAKFIKELHNINTNDAPSGGLHNYYRGCHLSVYNSSAKANIIKLSNFIDSNKCLNIWEEAISSKWDKHPVWIHGDFASGNILVKENQLTAVIDFGCMGIGDPACDLVISWTFFHGKSRQIFKENVGLDTDTWARARGWVLWKTCFELVEISDKKSQEALNKIGIISEILDECD